ncbi:MAG: hypothetical protein K2P93_07630 [Alphaproteobacteria bacterium]|nr:hypothetical protein [Alphaproteobacteria bacterium]
MSRINLCLLIIILLSLPSQVYADTHTYTMKSSERSECDKLCEDNKQHYNDMYTTAGLFGQITQICECADSGKPPQK